MKPVIKNIYDKIFSKEGSPEFNDLILGLCDGSKTINIMLPSLQAFLLAICSYRLNVPVFVKLDAEESHQNTLTKDLRALLGGAFFSFPNYKNEALTVSGFVSKSKQTFDASYRALCLSKPGVYLIDGVTSKYKISTIGGGRICHYDKSSY